MIADGSELALVRSALQGVSSIREVKMFGGTAFMVNGHITVAVSPRGLLVRVGPEAHPEAVKRPGARVMEMRGRVMTGYVYVNPAPTDAGVVRSWVQSALHYNRTLSPKNTNRTRVDAPKNKLKTVKRARRKRRTGGS